MNASTATLVQSLANEYAAVVTRPWASPESEAESLAATASLANLASTLGIAGDAEREIAHLLDLPAFSF
ncbi:hypothetical protein [Brachybacterium sp. FME24]|uniref:hypothetical protein n=1 Tax=Brachybacterium sp. FME24 TaxID=2742605 RepID=UPI001868C23C|nr:hypothetical protein [Brachybacterium sp. FME24]